MDRIIDFLVEPYRLSATYLIVLEILAATTGILSVYFSRIETILVYPSGLISTGIYVYILNVYELRGDMLINAYFFAMSIYGWINWSRALKGTTSMLSITRTNLKEKMYGILIFAGGILFVYYAYKFFNTKITYITYIDSLNLSLIHISEPTRPY